MAKTLTIVDGRLRVNDGDSALVLSPRGSGSEPCCCCPGFQAFDGSDNYYQNALFIDFDSCSFTADGNDGYFAVKPDCSTPGFNAIVVASVGGYASIRPVGFRTNVPSTWPISSAPSNTPTYAALIINPACNNPTGDKIGWLLS